MPLNPTPQPAQALARAREAPLQTRTKLAQAAFLAEFRQTCNVRLACEQCGVGRRTVYEWRERDPEFQRQYADAEQDAVDRLEAAAWRRSVDGVELPVYQKGQLVGTTREYSDHLMIALLKAHRPEKYQDSAGGFGPKVIVQLGVKASDVRLSAMPDSVRPDALAVTGPPPEGSPLEDDANR
jgi:hypothetical protein